MILPISTKPQRQFRRRFRRLLIPEVIDIVVITIPEDIAWIFDISGDTEETSAEAVGDLWDKDGGTIEGGKNYAGGD